MVAGHWLQMSPSVPTCSYGRRSRAADHQPLHCVCSYRDVNYVNACSSHDMSPEVLRKAILGALRHNPLPTVLPVPTVLWLSLTHQARCLHLHRALVPHLCVRQVYMCVQQVREELCAGCNGCGSRASARGVL